MNLLSGKDHCWKQHLSYEVRTLAVTLLSYPLKYITKAFHIISFVLLPFISYSSFRLKASTWNRSKLRLILFIPPLFYTLLFIILDILSSLTLNSLKISYILQWLQTNKLKAHFHFVWISDFTSESIVCRSVWAVSFHLIWKSRAQQQ